MFRLIGIAVLSLLALAVQAADTLNLGATHWPPFTSRDSKANMASELVESALKRSGYTGKTELLDWPEVMKRCNNGQLDGVVTLWQSNTANASFIYSQPYLENRIKIASLAKAGGGPLKLVDLKNKVVGVVTDYLYTDDLEANDDFTRRYSANDTDNLQALIAGKVDAILIDELTANYLFSLQTEYTRNHLRLSPEVVAVQKLHFAVRNNRPDAVAVINLFNKAINDMIRDGSYNRILNLPWIVTSGQDPATADIIIDQASRALPTAEPKPYPLFSNENAFESHKKRQYRVQGRTYQTWEQAKDAIIKEEKDKISDLPADPGPEYQWVLPLRDKGTGHE